MKPNSNINTFVTFYSDILHKLSSERRNIFITGDFNIDLLKCSSDLWNVNSYFGLISVIKKTHSYTSQTAFLIYNIYECKWNGF